MKTLLFTPFFATALAASGSLQAAPPTLLDIAGVHARPAKLSESALLVIDAQQDYLATGKLPLTGIAPALRQAHRMLERARAAHTPIIHVQQLGSRERRLFAPDTPGFQFADETQPQAGEIIIQKRLPNAFAGTTLDQTLQNLGRKELIVIGYMTHMCVSATVRSALDHGYHVTLVANTCATRDLPGVDGTTLPAEVVHRVALAELADRFATIVPSVDDIPE